MKVSVIIPVYNCEKYIEQCLDSLLNQTLDEMEIIAVNDGSTDSSYDILMKYQALHSNKLKVYTKENGGQSSARNLGLQHATGEFLGFVDSDDWVDLDMYEKMYLSAKEDNSDIVICDMIDHYPNIDVYHDSSKFESKFTVTPSACNKIFRREFVKENLFPLGLWYEDFEYTTKALFLTENISCVHRGFYHCHCREVSTMSNDNAPKNLDILTVLDHLYEFVEQHQLLDKYKSDLEYLVLDHVVITTINRVAVQKHPEKSRVLKELLTYSKKKLPHLTSMQIYKDLPKNRKIVAYLNYIGFYYVSKLLLELKKELNHK